MPTKALVSLQFTRPNEDVVAVRHIRSGALNLGLEQHRGDAVTEDDVAWPTVVPGLAEWSAEVETLAPPGSDTYTALKAAHRKLERITVVMGVAGGNAYYGGAFITSLTRPRAVNGVATVGFTISGAGPASVPSEVPQELVLVSEGNEQITLGWNTVDGVDGYYVHWGTSSKVYTDSEQVTAAAFAAAGGEWTIEGLENDTTYFFAVTSYIEVE